MAVQAQEGIEAGIAYAQSDEVQAALAQAQAAAGSAAAQAQSAAVQAQAAAKTHMK